MASLKFDFKNIALRNKDGSQATQSARVANLDLCAKQLKEMGFKQLRATGFKQKHAKALLERWQIEGLSTGTIKNRMSHLRWLSDKIGKSGMIPKDNAELGIERRVYKPTKSKAVNVTKEILEKIDCNKVRLSIELQKEFGLRREESIKFNVSYADMGDRIRLKSSWCKGGRARLVPVRTEKQRQLLERVRAECGKGSLIPSDKRYIDHLNTYLYKIRTLNLSKLHGLRHLYAQTRYKELTGLNCPLLGGKSPKDLKGDYRRLDKLARQIISEELGHSREKITTAYIGS